MNKKGLICLPLIAAMLGGCDFSKIPGGSLLAKLDIFNFFGGKDQNGGNNGGNNNGNNNQGNTDSGNDDQVEPDFDTDPNLGLEEFSGYKRAGKPVEGKKYLLGYYDYGRRTMRFANGDYHKDSGKTYPFYMATTDNTTEGAAEFSVTYVDDEETQFLIKASCSGKPWDEKYISVYGATSSFSNNVFSFANVADVNEKYSKDGTDYDVFGVWEYYDEVEDGGTTYEVKTIGAKLTHPAEEDETTVMFGCKCYSNYDGGPSEYISIDCSRIGTCIGSEYSIAHLYEKI